MTMLLTRTHPDLTPSRLLPAVGRLVLLASAGLALALATSNRAVAIAAWLAPVLMVRFLRTTTAWRGLVAGATVNAVAFSWAWQAQWPIPPLLLAGLATVFFLPYLADRLLWHRLAPLPATFVLPTAWIAVEYALVHLPLLEGSPIGSWAAQVHSQHGLLPLLQLVAVVGPWGITFLIGWTATVANLVWERGLQPGLPRRLAATLAMVLLAVPALGGLRLALTPTATDTVRVAGVAIDNDEILVRTWSPVRQGTPLTEGDRDELADDLTELHDQLFALSEREISAGAQVVAWAEDNALVFRDDADALIERGRRFAAQHHIALFLGMVVLEADEPADNQVVGITPDGEVAFTYLKSYPAPGEGSRPGDGQIAWMDTTWGRIGTAICFDYDFPALIRQAGRAGVDIMINPADDTPAIDPLHPHMAIPRAIENGVSMIRPTQGARSVAVDPLGRLLAVHEADAPTRHFAVDLPTDGKTTVYPYIGDALAQLAVIALLGLTIGALRPRSANPRRRTTAAVAALLLLSSCAPAEGTDRDSDMHPAESPVHDHRDNTAPITDAQQVAITASAMSFSPPAIEIRAGEPVNLALTSADTFHDLNIEGTDVHLGAHARETAIGGMQLERPGSYVAYCSIPGHREAGMELVVGVR